MNGKLKILRIEKNITQRDISKVLEIYRGSYMLKENGKRDFTVPEAKKLMELFNKKFEELF